MPSLKSSTESRVPFSSTLSLEEFSAIEFLAKKKNCSVSAVVRECVQNELARLRMSLPREETTLEGLYDILKKLAVAIEKQGMNQCLTTVKLESVALAMGIC